MELRLDGQVIVILRKNLGRKGAFEMVELEKHHHHHHHYHHLVVIVK